MGMNWTSDELLRSFSYFLHADRHLAHAFLRYLSAMWHFRLRSRYHLTIRKKLETFGEHIRKRRLELRLLQSDVAQLLLADKTSVFNWENNRTMPQVRHIPKIIGFLGYNPLPTARSLSEKLMAARRTLGLSQRAMAKRLGIDPGTLQAWESGRRCPSKKLQRIIDDFLKSREPDLD